MGQLKLQRPGPVGEFLRDRARLAAGEHFLGIERGTDRVRPWVDAAPGEGAEPLSEEVVAELRRRGATVATGVVGAAMRVSSVNEGPMTRLREA